MTNQGKVRQSRYHDRLGGRWMVMDRMPFLYYETYTIPSLTLLKIVTSEQKKLLFKLFKSFVFSLEGTIIIIM